MADVNVAIEADEGGGTSVRASSRLLLPSRFLASDAVPTAINEGNIASVLQALREAERRRDLDSE